MRYSWDTYPLHPAVDAFIKHDPVTNELISCPTHIDAIPEFINTHGFTVEKRQVLYTVLKNQTQALHLDIPQVNENIERIKAPTTFTVTCGHQLVLWSGPLFVWTKIAHCIAICKRLQIQFPQYQFVPVFWLAAEDHDTAEIQTVHVFGKRYHWPVTGNGPVGELIPNSELNNCRINLQNAIQGLPFADAFNAALNDFQNSKHLSQAVQGLLYRFFGSEGLVCIDANRAELKQLFKNQLKADILHQETIKASLQTMQLWQSKQWKPVIGFRPCNIFYIFENTRKRIDKSPSGFELSDKSKSWTTSEMELEIDSNPERFSPNALLRPLYQQYILPNIMYVAGPQELAYWLQLKSVFKHYNISFPLLSLRYMQIPLSAKTIRYLHKLNLQPIDTFKTEQALLTAVTCNDPLTLHAVEWNATFKSRIEDLGQRIYQVDASLKPAFEAETHKYLKGIERLISKSNAKIKSNATQFQQQINNIKNAVFPQHQIIERTEHPAQWYLLEGPDFIKQLIMRCEQLEGEIVFYATARHNTES